MRLRGRSKVDEFVPQNHHVNLTTAEVVEMVSKAVLAEAASWKVFFAQKWTDLYRKPTMST
jgi:hypothetical protein